jgi:hypothetical protein
MVEAILDSAGVWIYRAEPFIAERATIRLAWYPRVRRVKIEQVAKIIDINRSNVSRGSDSVLVPPPRQCGRHRSAKGLAASLDEPLQI